MKQCTKCKKYKKLSEFSNSSRNRDGKHCWCRLCRREYDLQNYPNVKHRIVFHHKKSLKRYDNFIDEFLQKYPCVDCGESNPIVLEFDHVRGIKEFNISKMRGYSLRKIINEVDKCEVVCANCHRIRTHNRLQNRNKPL